MGNEEQRRINESVVSDRDDNDGMEIVIEVNKEDNNNDNIGPVNHHTVMTNRWEKEEEYGCGYHHENEHEHEREHEQNHVASKSTSTRRVIDSDKMDSTLSYLVGSSSSSSRNTTANHQMTIAQDAAAAEQEQDEEDSTWGYYDHASISEQPSISTTRSDCDYDCDSMASSSLSFSSSSSSLPMSMSMLSMSSSMYNGRINYFTTE